MVTLRDIAHCARVSTATVSNVLNDTLYVSPELRERVLEAVRVLNYRPNTVARSLRSKRSHTIGIVVPDVTNPFFPALVRGAEDVLTNAGYTLIIGNSDNDAAKEESYYRTFLDRQIDGLLTVPTSDKAPATLKSFADRSIAIVYVDRAHRDLPHDLVLADNRRGAERCVEHLIGGGSRRIATITGPLSLSNARDRLTGYRLALKGAKLRAPAEYVREGAFDVASGRACMRQLLALKSPPDAVFVANALMACGAIEALQESDVSCPRDIALACFDQLDFLDLLRPRLTRVAAPSYELGTRGAELLLKRISGKVTGAPSCVVLETPLIIRESSLTDLPRRDHK